MLKLRSFFLFCFSLVIRREKIDEKQFSFFAIL